MAQVKICGLIDQHSVQVACKSGAAFIGLNFFQKSPRYVSPSTARDLAINMPEGVCKVALTVDADDQLLEEIVQIVPIDMLQLHGSESPERVAQVREKFGLPVMKAIGIADESDLAQLDVYARVADQLLVDAKPPKKSPLPGGNGLPFDWRLIAGRRWAVPWMLAGGLTPQNVAQAMSLTGAQAVDVSSGVEKAPGQKDEQKIAAFIQAARGE
jgi:phosphoribosylanthranilate isomerase